MNFLAPPNCLIQVEDHVPHTIRFEFSPPTKLTATGITNVSNAFNAYLTAAKKSAIALEWNRYTGQPGEPSRPAIPAAVVTDSNGTCPVLDADVAAQVAALQTLIAAGGNT